MKLLFVISSMSPGGAERVLSILASNFAKNHTVIIATLSNEASFYPLDEKIIHRRLGLMKDSKGFFQSIINSIGRIVTLQKVFREEDPDVVVSFMTHTNIIAVLSAKIARKKIVIAERIAYDYYGSKVLDMYRRLIYPLADALVTQTRADRENYPFVKNCHIIPNPLQPAKQDTPATREKLVLGVGRLERQKGFDLLIRAFHAIGAKDWRLAIVGEGSERENLQRLIADLGASNIELAGKTEKIFDWYKKASIFVLSSVREGFPNVLIEAMSAGCAVVSFDCPYGPGEIIDNGANGILVENQNQEELQKEIHRLMEDENTRIKLGEEAKKLNVCYSIETVAAEWEKIIRRVLGLNRHDKRSYL